MLVIISLIAQLEQNTVFEDVTQLRFICKPIENAVSPTQKKYAFTLIRYYYLPTFRVIKLITVFS